MHTCIFFSFSVLFLPHMFHVSRDNEEHVINVHTGIQKKNLINLIFPSEAASLHHPHSSSYDPVSSLGNWP